MAIIYDPEQLTYLQALRNLQARGELSYKTYSNDWIIKFWSGTKTHFMLSRVPDVNTQVAGEIATDKVGTYLLLADAGLPAVPHLLLNTPAAPEIQPELLTDLLVRYGQLVIKPTHGSMGRDVTRCADVASIMQLVAAHEVSSWAASPQLDIRSEARLVVFDGKVRLAYEKHDPPLIGGLKMFNLNLGAKARSIDPATIDPAMSRLAVSAMQTIGLRLGAVDIISTSDGLMQVLEINSRFSIEHYASLSTDNYQQAVAFYEALIQSMLH